MHAEVSTSTTEAVPTVTSVYNDSYGTMNVVTTLVLPAREPACPCTSTGIPLGGAGRPGDVVTGNVSDYSGHPVAGICIDVIFAPPDEILVSVRTDDNGNWHTVFPDHKALGMLWFRYMDCTNSPPMWAFPPTFFTTFGFESGGSVTIQAKTGRAATIDGIVVDDKGNPAPNTGVDLFDGYQIRKTVTDATGHFQWVGLESIPMGVAAQTGFDDVRLTVPPGITTFVTIRLLSPADFPHPASSPSG